MSERPQTRLHRTARGRPKERFAEFATEWGSQYPAIVRLWQDFWTEFTPFLDSTTMSRVGQDVRSAISSSFARRSRSTPIAPGSASCQPT